MTSLPQLFHWAIENSDPNQPITEQVSKEINPIDKKWLDLMTKSDADKMKDLVRILTSKDSSLTEKEASLEEMEAYVQSVDNANDLFHHTINGLKPVLEGLTHENPVIRWRSAWVLATASSNNPRFQTELNKYNIIELLIQRLQEESKLRVFGELECLAKLVTLAAAVLDHNTPAQKDFWQHKGFPILLNVLSMDQDVYKHLEESSSTNESKASSISSNLDREAISNVSKDQKESTDASDESEGKNIAATFEIVDVKERVHERAKVLESVNRRTQSSTHLWIRTARRILFLFWKILNQSEQFKVAFAKEQDGYVVKKLLDIMETHDDSEMKETIAKIFQSLMISSNPTMQSYIIGVIKGLDLKERLTNQMKKLSTQKDEKYDVEIAVEILDEVVKQL